MATDTEIVDFIDRFDSLAPGNVKLELAIGEDTHGIFNISIRLQDGSLFKEYGSNFRLGMRRIMKVIDEANNLEN